MTMDKSFGPRLNVQRLLMELETYITQNTSIPFTNKVIVERDDVYDLIDNIRAKLPDELKECEKFLKDNKHVLEELEKEKQQILQEALSEKQQLIEAAQIEAQKILDSQSPREQTQIDPGTNEHSEQIIWQAKKEAQRIVDQAKEFSTLAEERAQEIIAEAQDAFTKTSEDVDYLMTDLAQYLEQNIQIIRQGRREIKEVMPINKRKRKKQN